MAAADTSTHDELIRLQNEWMDAWQRRDQDALESIIAPEFTLTSARSDRLVSREQWLDIALHRAAVEWYRYEDFHVTVFGDAAVVKSRATQKATVDGADWSESFLLTDVWVGRDGRWQVVARHSSTPPATSF